MNRIYQGRVTKVEVENPVKETRKETPWLELPDWGSRLWEHHELFQDAINYYTLALAAMVEGCAETAFQEKWIRIATERVGMNPKTKDKGRTKVIVDAEGRAKAQLKALTAWREQVADTWVTARRKAEKFAGPQAKLQAVLNLEPSSVDFGSASKRVLETSRATPEQRITALLQLLEEIDKGDMNKVCGERLPFLATAMGKLNATSKALSSVQEARRQQVVREIHQVSDKQALQEANSLDLGLFLTQPPTESAEGMEAVELLAGYFRKATVNFDELKSIADEFKKFLESNKTTLQVPKTGRKPSGLYPVAAVYKFFPTAESLAAFRRATQSLVDAKDKAAQEDAIAEARAEDRPHFDYFTNRALIREKDEKSSRAVWFEFDLAAFIEAVKSPHRYLQDTVKREDVAERLRKQIAAMEGRGREHGEDDEESLPGFDGDDRIHLLREVVEKKLAWLADDEIGVDDAKRKEYMIRERTIRGFGEIKRQWRAEHDAGQATEARLLEVLAEIQARHRDDFGSAPFYSELAKPKYHPIWRDGCAQEWHAEDPLIAWLSYKELQAELGDKERPIRFTPAHPEKSPRFFIFPKKSEKNEKKKLKTKTQSFKAGLSSQHQSGQLSFTAGVILSVKQGLQPVVARLSYSAPRLCRDHIRQSGEENLYASPWLQPMMNALGLDQSPEQVNFANCRITLQPESRTDIQLTFPVEVGTEKIRTAVAREAVWEKQFNQSGEDTGYAPMTLRWPHEKQPAKGGIPWHENITGGFCCFATDLGQRDAGAFARLLVRSDGQLGGKPSRFIGQTGKKEWRAVLQRSGLFRLPGEDAKVWRQRSPKDYAGGEGFAFREELWGESGRPARDWEADETVELMRLFESPVDDANLSLVRGDWRKELSFPEQNDKLLVAARRYLSRISRLHRWCWFLAGDEKKQQTAWDEIKDCDDPRLVIAELRELAGKRDPRVCNAFQAQLQKRLTTIPQLIERLAHRILPLRGRSWHWELHPDSTDKNRLHHLVQNGPSLDTKDRPIWLRGQRGLSLERIEEIEDLRKLFQRLNQLQRRDIGGVPPTRRDESVPDPCHDILDKLDRLKEQRVNQTAHMILAEALGVRLAPPPANKKELLQSRDQHGMYEKILSKNGQWIGPADFIVIEDLSRYRTSQGRAPRENSRLMKWCHRAVRDKLRQLCEVFGLPVLETPAAYSSRFCSRSGVVGFRAVEVGPEFENEAPWYWIKEKQKDGKPTTEAEFVRALAEQMRDANSTSKVNPRKPRTLLAPVSGGPIFVPFVSEVPGADLAPAIVQADINAAINLALRAIGDPVLWNIHPRVRTAIEKGKLVTREKRKFSKPRAIKFPSGSQLEAGESRQPNFFADVSGKVPGHSFTVENESRICFVSGKALREILHDPALHRCMEINAARLKGWGVATIENKKKNGIDPTDDLKYD